MNFYKCPICGNEDYRFIGFLRGKHYCRKCITFNGESVKESKVFGKDANIYLPYDLSNEQKALSNQLIDNFKNHTNSFVYAVCGSGKTEIVLGVIKYAIENHKRAGFSVPRREVAIELYERFKNIFRENKITLVIGGYNDVLYGDLVVCTTHQLYRYKKYFDLLLIDEVDAFPFKGDDVLQAFFYRAVKENYIMMSATASEEELITFGKERGKVLRLSTRFHGHPIPIPETIYGNKLYLNNSLYRLINNLNNQGKQVFVFAPTIQLCEEIFRFTKIFCRGGDYVHSKREGREQIIKDFKNKKISYLITTSILERGVTVKDLQVVVYLADHEIYNTATLIQIAGRVGRKKDAPEGRVIFLCEKTNKHIQETIKTISENNKSLQNLW